MDHTDRPREIWTRLAVDPFADPLARILARRRWVTPDRVTAVALSLGIGAAACFVTGNLRWGGLLFLARFFADCVDGKVARLQGSASARGAFFDLAADVLGVTLAAATLSWRLVTDGDAGIGTAIALLGLLVLYNWVLGHRKHLAENAGLGTGGARHDWHTDLPVLRGWIRICRRLQMSAVPWALEAEIATFGLAPLAIPHDRIEIALLLAVTFYAVAIIVNATRVLRITTVPTTVGGARRDAPPSVDVVVATRDRPELLSGALRAIWDQDYPGRITVHVVFDQTPANPALERSAPNRRIVVTENARTPGLAGARNTGILAAEGVLVAFCDDDDRWLPDKLSRQVEQLVAEGATTAVTGIVVEYADHAVARVPARDDLFLDHLVRHRVMEAHPSTVLVRRASLLEDIGLVDEQIPGSYGEDFDWLIRAARTGPIAVAARPLVRVQWGRSMFARDWQTIIDAIDYGIAKTPEFRADPQALARLYGRRAFAQAALGGTAALREVIRTLRVSPREKRAYLAAAVALHLVSAEWLMDLANRRGRGI